MPKKPDSESIRIRMYRVGFGDCFLVSFPGKDGAEHVLIDCGVHPMGDIGTMAAAVDDIARETDEKLALIVGSHAQQDHISGFASHAKVFSRFKVRQVWLPWTETPNDKAAARIEQRRAALLGMLTRHFAVRPARVEVRVALDAAVANMNGSAAALHLLKRGLRVQPNYVHAGNRFSDAGDIVGLSGRILGPPKNADFLANDFPSDERFQGAAGDAETEPEEVNAVVPFDQRYQVDPKRYPYYQMIAENERERNLLAVAASNLEGLAFAMDRAVSNTSIVTLFSFRGKQLLFPGDARYRDWLLWIDDEEIRYLLGELNFLKVPNHGSLNAMPLSAIKGLPEKGFAAMVPTQCEPWATIPTPKVMKALEARASAVVRSDSIPVKGAPPGPLPGRLPRDFTIGEFWVDYRIPV